ncbi:hypothetical protein M758_11G055600 [Ceratodon purpureus]|uniref:Secreted protein n=1 Tax=Ceratodon purpureus TaxID=3225 RepID=A0A8T0GAU3_CERPU|nr:hypothetical protein KC19_11G057200 [Ceratodon purpureus]KAG0600715.1 hypothetical protein M758_11G055600 [Ceratodon purpureus]
MANSRRSALRLILLRHVRAAYTGSCAAGLLNPFQLLLQVEVTRNVNQSGRLSCIPCSVSCILQSSELKQSAAHGLCVKQAGTKAHTSDHMMCNSSQSFGSFVACVL